MNKYFLSSVFVFFMTMSLLPPTAKAEGYTGRLLKVYFGIQIPQRAPSVTIGYGDHSTSVQMQSLVFKFTEKLDTQKIPGQVHTMCQAYYRTLELGRKSMPRVYDGMLYVTVGNYVDGKLAENLSFDLIDRNSDPFVDGAPFPKMRGCTAVLTSLVMKASAAL